MRASSSSVLAKPAQKAGWLAVLAAKAHKLALSKGVQMRRAIGTGCSRPPPGPCHSCRGASARCNTLRETMRARGASHKPANAPASHHGQCVHKTRNR
ncbi:hypothetical protein [Chlorobaculum thiosulfatiphilum]|uniref:hypothetical protein n=1 Tax=Chlorobaculum thiosulfatiphilum TaxID=115852 RepID=UPI001FE86D73|nr:hypothetical protein [Chlorobaculum thiosulfatiphilum]